MLPRSTHATFTEMLYQTFKGHKLFEKPKLSTKDLTNCHYAGDFQVTYQSDYVLDMNQDYVVPENQALMNASKDSSKAYSSILLKIHLKLQSSYPSVPGSS